MKKVLLSVLAVGMLTACSQDETVDMQAPSQIAFAGAFVDNVTRAAVDPSITTGTIDNFSVWGYVKNNAGTLGEVFDAVEVTKAGEAWTYSPLQYWVANNQYNFFALATNTETKYIAKEALDENKLAATGIGEISFTNEDGSEDLLYATASATTGPSITTAPAPVKFVFDHLLSKVKFTFKNGFATGYSTIKVTDITMKVPSVGTINLNKQGEYTWNVETEGADPLTLEFDDIEKGVEIAEGAKGESDKERLTIPAAATQEYTVTFNVELLQDGATVLPATEHEVIISNYELKPGFAYNFVASIDASNLDGGLEPIKFTAEVEKWVEPNDVGFIGVGGEIKNNMTLGTDVTATSTISLAKGVTFDGNGYTLSMKEADKSFYNAQTLRLIQTNGAATIKNLTIDGNNTKYAYDGDNDGDIDNYGIRGIYLTGEGAVNIENVTINNVTYTINSDGTARTLNVKKSSFTGWTSFSGATTSTFEEVNFSGNFKPYANTTLSKCDFATGSYLDFCELAADKKVYLLECTYNGQPINADNIVTLFGENLEGEPVDKYTPRLGQAGWDTVKDRVLFTKE